MRPERKKREGRRGKWIDSVGTCSRWGTRGRGRGLRGRGEEQRRSDHGHAPIKHYSEEERDGLVLVPVCGAAACADGCGSGTLCSPSMEKASSSRRCGVEWSGCVKMCACFASRAGKKRHQERGALGVATKIGRMKSTLG
jgi:hypothetical protein